MSPTAPEIGALVGKSPAEAGSTSTWETPTALMRRIPRKEVIQPQLPLRLPCYDFTPVTDSTFDCSLPCGLGHRLRVFPAPVV